MRIGSSESGGRAVVNRPADDEVVRDSKRYQ
jgi:hypothetical protein